MPCRDAGWRLPGGAEISQSAGGQGRTGRRAVKRPGSAGSCLQVDDIDEVVERLISRA